MGGFRLVVDLLSNQTEPIISLFEQFSATKATVTSTNKNDPRLANTATSQTVQAQATASSTIALPPTTIYDATSMNTTGSTINNNSNSTNTNNKEERESISNAVASLPPAQVSRSYA